jgi:pimeloyl-ACP methyl ester carboxylesterase
VLSFIQLPTFSSKFSTNLIFLSFLITFASFLSLVSCQMIKLALLYILLHIAIALSLSWALYENCSQGIVVVVGGGGDNDGICPWQNTCCRQRDGSFGCVPSHAVCCNDASDTACGVNFACVPGGCAANATRITDPLIQWLPRYHLSHVDDLTVHSFAYASSDNGNNSKMHQLAYYSSHGDLEEMPIQLMRTIRMALIIIHGSNRNADDYFATALSLVEQQHQSKYKSSKILVLAPWFPLTTDVDVPPSVLQWNDDGLGGPWRYGASAAAFHDDRDASSFAAIDALITSLQTTLPLLETVTVAGHSAGGQFFQRWALLTPVITSGNDTTGISIRAVVANPSSYAYLTPLLWSNGHWNTKDATKCPHYNDWEWGLRVSKQYPAPYVSYMLVQQSHPELFQRFDSRSVYYLAGSQDVCTIPDNVPNGWCHSHGLETTCMDMVQGVNRWERNWHYFQSLALVNVTRHRRLVILGVGHDHSLMFHSPHGLEAMFGGSNNISQLV